MVVTRPRAQAQAFAGLLEAAGARVLLVPTIVIEPPASWEPLDRALERLDDYTWAVFTSVNGVEMTRRRLEDKGRGADALRGRRLAAIGPATAEALRAIGLEPEVVPEEYVAEALAERLRALIGAGDRVLLARAAETRDVLVTLARGRGRQGRRGAGLPDAAGASRRTRRSFAGRSREGRVDVVTFTSSSTVRHFAALFPGEDLPGLLRGVAVACIGPVTRATAEALGLEARIVPREYTIPALAQSHRRPLCLGAPHARTVQRELAPTLDVNQEV